MENNNQSSSNETERTKFDEVSFYNKYIDKVTCAFPWNVRIVDGEARVYAKRTQEREKYLFKGLKEDLSDKVILIECPSDIFSLEYENHKQDEPKNSPNCISREKINLFIKESEKKIKELNLDYCVCDHGGTSPYIWICNLKGLREGKENADKKRLLKLITTEESIEYVDVSNLGNTLVPVINRPHWKPKYGGVIHKIICGKIPNDHNNDVSSLLKEAKTRSHEFIVKNSQFAEAILHDKMNVSDVFDMSKLKESGSRGEYIGPHPIHGSSKGEAGTNLNVNPSENGFHCHRHNTGGGVAKAIALIHGLKRCEELNEDLDTETQNKVLEIAKKEYGIKLEEDKKKKEKKDSALQKNIIIVKEGIEEFFMDTFGAPYATIRVNSPSPHLENCRIFSRAFKNYIVRWLFEKTGKVPNSNRRKDLIDMCEGLATSSNIQKKVYLRAARIDDTIYIDLCNKNWNILKITKDNISITDAREIKFQRQSHMKELMINLDAEPGDIDRVFKYLGIKNEEERTILRSHLTTLLIDNIPTAILIGHGSQGSGKTFRFKIIRELVDPSELKVLSLGKDVTQLVQQLSHHFFAVYDNVTHIPKEISDLICRATTGEGFTKREIFTVDEDFIYSFIRKTAFNGINVATQEADFLDRSFMLKFERIPAHERKTEAELLSEFEKDKALITGAIIKLLQKSLGIIDDVKIETLPRMADYARWGEAAARAYGKEAGAFINAYFNKIEKINTEVLDGSAVGMCIIEFVDLLQRIHRKKEWIGTPSELYELLFKIAEPQQLHKSWDWPKGPNSLTRRINDIIPNLQDGGIIVLTGVRIGMKRGIRIEITPDETKTEEESEK